MTRLTRTLDYILRKYGHDVLLQRKTDSGYSNVLERHTVRHWMPGNPTETLFYVEEGLLNDVDFVYAARADMKPKEYDRLYEKDEGLGQQQVFRIDFAVPMRGIGGKIVYWLIGATREEPS